MTKKLAAHRTSMAYNFSLHFFLISSFKFFSTFFKRRPVATEIGRVGTIRQYSIYQALTNIIK